MSDFMHEKIAVIWIWSTWCGVIDNMIDQWTQWIEFIWISVGKPCTCLAKNKVKILNYQESYENKKDEKSDIDRWLSDIKKIIDWYDMVFILSDSTWSDWSWIIYDIVKLCKSIDILTISIISDPLKIESKSVKDDAIEFKNKLKKIWDALIVLPSENIIKNTGLKDISIKMMYSIIQDYFIVTVKSIADILIKTWEIHIVFDDIYAIFNNSGIWWIWVWYWTGEWRCKKAYNMAINSFWPWFNLEKVKSILFIFTGHDLNINEVHETSKLISKEKFINEKIWNIWCMIDDEIKNYNWEVRITIIWMWLNN
jgi:cell division GTPase FtsZ